MFKFSRSFLLDIAYFNPISRRGIIGIEAFFNMAMSFLNLFSIKLFLLFDRFPLNIIKFPVCGRTHTAKPVLLYFYFNDTLKISNPSTNVFTPNIFLEATIYQPICC